jgi:glucan-binding YG repeat protein
MVNTGYVVSQNTVLYAQWEVDKTSEGWYPVDGIWYYLCNGQVHEGFFQDSGLTYYAENGIPVVGWKTIEGEQYYFGRNGVMHSGLTVIDGVRYLLGEDGATLSGWAELDGASYYLNSNGSLCTGWISIAGQLHYFDMNSGKLVMTQTQNGNPFDFVIYDKNLASSLLDSALGLLAPVSGN